MKAKTKKASPFFYTEEETKQIINAVTNRNGKPIAQVAKDLSLHLYRPWARIVAKIYYLRSEGKLTFNMNDKVKTNKYTYIPISDAITPETKQKQGNCIITITVPDGCSVSIKIS